MKKFLVFLVGDFIFTSTPDRLNRINFFPVQFNRRRDEIRVTFDDAFNRVFLGIPLLFFLELNDNFCTPWKVISRFQFVAAFAVGGPAPALRLFLVASGIDCYFVTDHEGCIETDSELADQVRVSFIFGKLFEKSF